MIVSEAFRFFFRSLLTTEYWTPEARHQHNLLYNSISFPPALSHIIMNQLLLVIEFASSFISVSISVSVLVGLRGDLVPLSRILSKLPPNLSSPGEGRDALRTSAAVKTVVESVEKLCESEEPSLLLSKLSFAFGGDGGGVAIGIIFCFTSGKKKDSSEAVELSEEGLPSTFLFNNLLLLFKKFKDDTTVFLPIVNTLLASYWKSNCLLQAIGFYALMQEGIPPSAQTTKSMQHDNNAISRHKGRKLASNCLITRTNMDLSGLLPGFAQATNPYISASIQTHVCVLLA